MQKGCISAPLVTSANTASNCYHNPNVRQENRCAFTHQKLIPKEVFGPNNFCVLARLYLSCKKQELISSDRQRFLSLCKGKVRSRFDNLLLVLFHSEH